MILLQKLKINANKSIDVVMPSVEDKFNSYCAPISNLHEFDEITVIFKEKRHETIIGSDLVEIIVSWPKQKLEKVLNEELILPDNIEIGNLGYRYNVTTYDEHHENFNYARFTLWSGGLTESNLHAFIYNRDNKIYLEIAPVYPWIWDEPTTNNDHISFNEFMKTYKSIAIEEINRTTIQKWIEQCNKILNTMITVQPKDHS